MEIGKIIMEYQCQSLPKCRIKQIDEINKGDKKWSDREIKSQQRIYIKNKLEIE